MSRVFSTRKFVAIILFLPYFVTFLVSISTFTFTCTSLLFSSTIGTVPVPVIATIRQMMTDEKR